MSILESAKKMSAEEHKKRTTPDRTLKLQDGTDFGAISHDGYMAIRTGNLDSYTPTSEVEKETISKYKTYATRQATRNTKNLVNSAHLYMNPSVTTQSVVSTQYSGDSQLTESQKAYKKYAVDKKTDIEGVNNKQKLLGGDTAQWVAAPEKSWWDKTVDNVKDFFSDTFLSGTNAGRIYDEATGFKNNKAAWTDDQLASLAITALHNADSGDTTDLAIVDEALARLSRSSKYKDSDLVLALEEAQKSWGASPFKAAGANVVAAVAGMGGNVASFANSLGADKVPLLKDLTNSAVEGSREAQAWASEYNKGTYGENLGVFTQGVVNLIPYVALGSGKAVTTVLGGSKYAPYVKSILQNPSFYYSLTSMWGQKYQEAVDNGASRGDALANAMLYAIPAALIEVGGGIGSQNMGIEPLSKTILGEIGEELAQDIMSGISDKFTTNPDLPWGSFTEDAVVNPVNLAKTAVQTAPIVAIAGGAHRIANLAYQRQQLKKLTNDQKVVDAVTKFSNEVYSKILGGDPESEMPQMSNEEIKKVGELYSNRADLRMLINEGLQSPEGSNSRVLAEQLDEKLKSNKKISNKEIGELVVENIKQITLEDSPDYVSARKSETTVVEEPITSNVETPTVSVGETFINTKSNNIIKVISRNDNATTIEITTPTGKKEIKQLPNKTADRLAVEDKYTKVGTSDETVATSTDETSKKTISLKRRGDSYIAFGDEAIALANELDEPTQKAVVNGVETDVFRVPANLMLKVAPTMSDEFNFVFSDKPQTKASENSPVVNETVATDETTSSDAENEADNKITAVANAINETFHPGAKEALEKTDVKGDVFKLAELITKYYKQSGNIDPFSGYFTDKGAKVISVLEGKAVEQTQETSKANSNDVLKNQSESDTIEEKTEDETSNDSDVVGPRVESPSVNVGDVYTNNKTGDVYTVANRDSENTTVYIKNKKGVTTTIIPNVLADDSFNVEDTFTKVTEKDTKSTTEPKAVESEENGNGRKRDSILPENSGRANNGSTQKQTERFSSFERRNKGKNESERQSFARDLIERGQVESVSDGECEYILVKPEAYNDDMVSMVEDAKSKGVELGFIIGDAKVFGDGKDFYVDGIKFNNSKVIVRYDGTRTPQKLAKHELTHAKWNTPEVQKAKNAILDSLTEEKKQEILSQERYARYKSETYNGNEEIALEEFVCDVMAGMNDYTENYNDVVSEYWNENETVEGYNPSTYAESTDAGGDNKFSFSSMGATFFGDENISAKDFEKMVSDGSYKSHKGYRDFVKNCVDVYKQSRNYKGMLPGSEVKKIEQQIEGMMKVAIAAKKAGYDIYDDGKARSIKDSKKRLLFSSLEPNSDYVTSSDVSTICDKAKNFTEIYDGIVNLEEERGVPADKRFFNNVDNYFILHKLLADKGLTIPCDECYVQALRKNLTPMANAFVELVTEENSDNKDNAQLYHQEGKDKGNVKKNNAEIRDKVRELCSQSDCPIKLEDLTPKMLTTADGLTELRLEAPLVYEAFNSFYGQSKPKMPKKATPFRPGELIAMFTDSKGKIKTSLVNKIKATGGFRLQSYGDFQIENYVDVLQTIFEAGMIGLNGHAYTKVPAFLEATDGTNLKRNISIFMYEDGDNWVIDKKNSFPMELEDIYSLVASDESGNTGIIAVSQNEDMSAWIMANELLGYGIPFHKSGTRMEIVRGRTVKTPDGREILGYANQKDHTKQQTEVYSKTLSDKQKENTKVKKPINIYQFWDFKNKDNLSKKDLIEKNVKRYIDECNKRNYRPKFREYVMDNEAVLDKVLHYAKKFGYVPQNATVDDISFKHGEYTIPYGYYKFLGDFGMFTPDGKASPIETLSLENYDFDKAVDFFKDSEKLRANELLQQFENGKVRENYRKMVNDGELTIEQLENILKEKRNEVVQAVVNGDVKFSFAEESESESNPQKSTDVNDDASKGELTKSEWNEFYRSLGELKKGKWFPQTSDGDYIFETNDKLIFTDGNYNEPKVNSVVVFEGLNAEEIEYGKETIWNYAETGKSCEECCEIAQAMLGKGTITSTNPYSGVTYRGGKNSLRKRKYSFAVDSENNSKVNPTSANKEFNLDDYTIDEILKWTPKQFDEAYKALALDNFVIEDDILLEDFELTDADVGEVRGGDFTIDEVSEALDEEPEKIEILIRRKGLGESHIVENNMAVMTKERIDREIKDSGATTPTYAQKCITRISPKDFLDLTVPQQAIDREVFDTQIEGEHGKTMRDFDFRGALHNSPQTPYLCIDQTTGRVKGHNGRHRVRSLEMSGIESVEILIQFEDENRNVIKHNPETIPDMVISSQFDTAIETHISNIIPLNETHREEIETAYGENAHNNAGVRYSFAENSSESLETQKQIESIAEDIGSHEELIEYAKKNTKEFVAKIKQNESLQKRLHNAKRQMLLSPKPAVNAIQVGKITKEILTEMDSTLKATDLKDEVMSIYNEYFAEIKKAKGVESKVQAANDNMMDRFANLAVDIVDSSEALAESENYEALKSYIRNTRIRVPDSAKADVHYAEFRKSHMGTFNLTNDGLDIDVAYMELCGMFPGMFDTEITHPADQLNEIANVLDNLKPYAYNPHSGYMQDAIDHVVFRFTSEVDGLAAMPKTKAQKMAEKSKLDKDEAIQKEKAKFQEKLDKRKEQSENIIRKLQGKIEDAKYALREQKQLSKEEKARAVKEVRDKRDIAILKSKIRNIVSGMKNNLDKTEKTGGYPKELVKAAADVCSAIDFHTDRTQKDGTPTKTSLKLDALKMQYDALKNNPNYDFASEYSEELSDKIANLHKVVSGKRIVDLTKAELESLKDILSEISHKLSTARKQIGQAEAKENFEIATEIINSLKADNKAISDIRNQLLKEIRLAKESGKAFVINPHRIFEMIANYDRDSAWWQLYDQILRGSRASAKFTMDATIPFDELTNGGGNEIAFYDFRTKTHKTGIKYVDGTEVELPKSIICELVMLWDRKQGRSHLESGGVKIPDLKLFNKGRTADSLSAGKMTNPITQADITRLKGMLDSYDKAWIERSRHLFNKVAKDAINETSMQLVGRELAKADNYIRIYVDSDFVNKDIGKNESDITVEGHGSLKETTPEAKNPVVLRGLHENVYEHIDFASKYYGLAIPIRNFNKIYKISVNEDGKQNSVKNMLGSVYGPKIRDGVVVQAIKDLQSPRHRELSFFSKVKGGWLNATFWANIRSTLKQTTSYWTASSILGEDSLVKGLASYNVHRKRTKAEIAKYSGTLYKRAQGLSTTELGDRANRKRLAGASSKVDKLINKYAPILRKVPEGIRPGNWLQSMDCAVSSALWEACKFEVSKTMNSSDEGYMQAVTDLYERVIEETQSNYDVLHRPEILKSTNMAYQTIGMFQNDNLQQSGIMYTAFGDLKAKHKAYKADKNSANKQKLKDAKTRMSKAIRSRIYSSMWLAAVSILGDVLLRKFKPYIDDEEKEITASSILEQMMLKMSEDMLSIFAPIVGELATKAMDTFGEGYDFLNDPAFDVLEDFIKATSKIYKAYEEDGDVLKAWIDAIPAISNMTGVPAKNISDLYTAIKGYIGDVKTEEFSHDLTDYTSGNKSFYDYGDLASYIVSGDTEKETKWLNYYSENGKEIAKASLTKEIKPSYVQMYIDSPLEAYNIKRKLILDYDYAEDTINKWTVAEYFKHAIPNQEYYDGTVSDPEYASEIADAIRKENGWKDNLYSAIRSEYKAAYKDEELAEADFEALKTSVINDFRIGTDDINEWESKAEEEIKKKEDKQKSEKEKYE